MYDHAREDDLSTFISGVSCDHRMNNEDGENVAEAMQIQDQSQIFTQR